MKKILMGLAMVATLGACGSSGGGHDGGTTTKVKPSPTVTKTKPTKVKPSPTIVRIKGPTTVTEGGKIVKVTQVPVTVLTGAVADIKVEGLVIENEWTDGKADKETLQYSLPTITEIHEDFHSFDTPDYTVNLTDDKDGQHVHHYDGADVVLVGVQTFTSIKPITLYNADFDGYLVNEGGIRVNSSDGITVLSADHGSIIMNGSHGIIDLTQSTNSTAMRAMNGSTIINNGTILLGRKDHNNKDFVLDDSSKLINHGKVIIK